MRRLGAVLALAIGCAIFASAQEKAIETHAAEESEDKWVVWRWANFALLAAGLGYLMAKHLPGYFRSRTESIQKDITEAQHTKRDAERRAAEMDARLSALGAEIEKFRAEARAEMEREGARIRQETAQQIEKLQRQAELEVESAGKTARRELSAHAAQLALGLAEQRIRTRLDPGTESGLIEDFVSDLRQRGSQN